ncbi:hypothetical protein Q8F55_007399 [Vanrija albida]|uniref:NADP-dependent oxidoreductase domain-containing protein n=1 Tax=Vanrija albida TaxID=181172 RepID=A0ABR3PTF6_9TREE
MPRTITLSDGKKVPAIGWGNGTGGLASSGSKAVDAGAIALEDGILHIDTAQLYETEAETAASIKKAGVSRDKVWITTKLSENTAAAKGTTADNIREAVVESIAKLETIPDLILIHNPYVPEKGKIGEFWTYLEDLVLDGTLKGASLGFSNFREQDIDDVLKVARIQPVVNQLEYHPFLLTQLEPLLAKQAALGIVTQSYGPLSPLLRHPSGGGSLKVVLERIAAERGVDAASILLLWTIQKGVVAVTSSTNAERIQKLADVDKLEDLTPEQIAEIDAAGKKAHYRYYKEHMFEDFPVPDLPEDA